MEVQDAFSSLQKLFSQQLQRNIVNQYLLFDPVAGLAFGAVANFLGYLYLGMD